MFNKIVILAAFFSSIVFAAESNVVSDLDFSTLYYGSICDGKHPQKLPLCVIAITPYSSLRGRTAIVDSCIRYASTALGRMGKLNALRLGNSKSKLENTNYSFQTGKPFSIEMWVNIYDVEKYFGDRMLNILSGYQQGLRLGFSKHKWSRAGWLNLIWGTQTGSDTIRLKSFKPNKWHHVVIAYNSKNVALYSDGVLIGNQPASINFGTGPAYLKIGSLDYKFDCMKIYNKALSTEEVKTLYSTHKPTRIVSVAEEKKILSVSLSPTLKSYGYFKQGDKIKVHTSELSLDDKLIINSKEMLSENANASYDKCGFYILNLNVNAKDNFKITKKFPVAIYPKKIVPTNIIGANNLVTESPASSSVGIAYDRIIVHWAEIEPRKNEYNWEKVDTIIERCEELKVKPIICLHGTPKWMQLSGKGNNLPADMSAYTKVWKLLLGRYSEVEFYEVGNADTRQRSIKGKEDDRYADYVQILKAAAAVIRKEAPKAKILAGRVNKISDPLKILEYLERNAKASYDIFSTARHSGNLAANISWAKAIVSASSKPVWNTGAGNFQRARVGLLPVKESAEYKKTILMIKDLMYQTSIGVQKFILLRGAGAYDPLTSLSAGLPGYRGLAIATLNGMLKPGSPLKKTPLANTNLVAFSFDTNDSTKAMLIFSKNGEHKYAVNASTTEVKIYSMLGKEIKPVDGEITISSEPLYVVNLNSINDSKLTQ